MSMTPTTAHRPCGTAIYRNGHRSSVEPVGPVACLYQRLLELTHGLVHLPTLEIPARRALL